MGKKKKKGNGNEVTVDDRPTGPLFVPQRFVQPINTKDDQVRRVVVLEGTGPFMVHRVNNQVGSGNMPYTVEVTIVGTTGNLHTLPANLF